MALQPGPRIHHDGSMAPQDHGTPEGSHASGRREPPDEGQELNEIGEDECFALLGRQNLGRLAIVRDGRPEIFPVNYAMDGRTITIRTGSGAKLTYASLARITDSELLALFTGYGYRRVLVGDGHEGAG